MKKTKILLLALLLIAVTVITAGCGGGKKAITAEEFAEIAEKEGLTFYDITADVHTPPNTLKSASKAVLEEEGYQGHPMTVIFYVAENEKKASGLYGSHKNGLVFFEDGAESKSEKSFKNGESYSLTSGESYSYICRIDNTFLEASFNKAEEEDDVKSFIKKLGY